MDECNDHLLFLEQIAEDKYRVKARRVGFRYNNNYDEELQMLARIATHHACDLVGGQYTASKQADYTIESEKTSPTIFTLTSSTSLNQFAVSLEPNTCNCMFNQTLLLPCRHIMFLRREASSYPSAIPFDAIPTRWSLVDDCREDDKEASGGDDTPKALTSTSWRM
ncbi:hypothetical protein F441_10946 [Phytophthora nicotianae CJ01A1]|uniref:SWIM-type domain-containing protein n=1 Tax=Phytophthora nicotianae CJ01A1 TaxID=1317063 RepID=W2WU81_PHYNI|nr:hypothetical protein F441_10946 [Phytophthora nicotianae CJ01A1]